MHVAIFSEHFHKDPSGPRLSVIEISRALVRRGVKVTILSLSPENRDEPIEGVGVAQHRRYTWKVVPVRYGRHRFCARMLHQVHRREPIDCVIAMGTWVGAASALFRHRTGVPFVHNPRSRVKHKPGDWQYDQTLEVVRGCDAFVGISETEVAGWCEDMGVERNGKFFAVHNGFEPAALQGEQEPVPGVPDDVPVVLCMAMLRRAKGQHRIMNALDTMGDVPWFAVFAGGGRAHEQEWVKERYAEIQLKDRMLLPGVVTGARWRWLYNRADVFCLTPVYAEALGNAFLEAQAAGLPVITSDGGGNVEVVSPESAIIVPRGENMTAEIAEALRLLLGDEGLRKRMGEAGMSRAAEFTWDRAGEGYMKAIEVARAQA
jgi:glycosyltransferase involved in cell wall biosynthesis